jgi:hypothetical protein
MTTEYRSILLTDLFLKALHTKYNIVCIAEQKQIDKNFENFEHYLRSIRKEYFDPNDRIVIEWFDTDFYFEDFDYGINFYNLINCFKKADIPLFTLLLVTNNVGMQAELDRLVLDLHDKPTIIESFCTKSHWIPNYINFNNNVSTITKHAISMMGTDRVHRHVLFRYFEQQKMLDTIATAAGPVK